MNHASRVGLLAVAVLGAVLGWGQPVQAWNADQDSYLGGGMMDAFVILDSGGPAGGDSKGEKVILTVISPDGVDLSHQELSGKDQYLDLNGDVHYLTHYDFIDTHEGVTVSGPLGTAVAGVATAKNVDNMTGTCPQCRILNLRVDMTNNDQIEQAIRYAAQQTKNAYLTAGKNLPANGVILLAYQDPVPLDLDNSLRDLLVVLLNQQAIPGTDVQAGQVNIVVVAPAGNGNPITNPETDDAPLYYPTDEPSYPCAYQATTGQSVVLCVGAVDRLDPTIGQRSAFSNYGEWVTFYAPGQRIKVTLPGNKYSYVHDTNAAAALAAGTAATLYFSGDRIPFDLHRLLQASTIYYQPKIDQWPFLELRKFLKTSAAVGAAGGGGNTPLAVLSAPGPSEPIRIHTTVPIRGSIASIPSATGWRWQLDLYKVCCPYNAAGVWERIIKLGATATQTDVVTKGLANSLLYSWNVDYSWNVNSPSGPPEYYVLPEGEYYIQLTVDLALIGGGSAVAKQRIFVDRSYDANFNGGNPLVLLNDTMNSGPQVADINDDGRKDILLGTMSGRKVYAFSIPSTATSCSGLSGPEVGGCKVFEGQAAGRIFATPAVGDIDGNDGGQKEIVATSDVTGTSLYAWETNGASILSMNIGPSKSSPAVGRRLRNDSKDEIFVTTTPNLLRRIDNTGTVRDFAYLTCKDAPTPDPLTDVNFSNYWGATNNLGKPGMNHPGPCVPPLYDKKLMESTPVLAQLNEQGSTPFRVYVASQDPFSTYGFDAKSTGLLKLLPGFPMPWSGGQPAVGGNFDVVVAVSGFDNDGETELFDVQYIQDTNPSCVGPTCNDRSRLVILEVQGSATLEPTNARQETQPATSQGTPPYAVYEPPVADLFMYSGAAAGDIVRTLNSQGQPDGKLEIVTVGMSGKVYLFTPEAQLVTPSVSTCADGRPAGWPQQMGGLGATVPLIADFDGSKTIITTSSDRLLYGWDANGCLKHTLASGRYGFPRAMKAPACSLPRPAASPMRNRSIFDIIRCAAPALGDIDGDGREELIAIAGNSAPTSNPLLAKNGIYVWDLVYGAPLQAKFIPAFMETAEACYPIAEAPWPTTHGGSQNAGIAAQAPLRGQVYRMSGATKIVMANAKITVKNATPILVGDRYAEVGSGYSTICESSPTGPNGLYQCTPTLCETTSDAGGNFSCPVNPNATYLVTAAPSGYSSQTKTVTIYEPPATTTVGFDFNQPAAITITNVTVGNVAVAGAAAELAGSPTFALSEAASTLTFPTLQFQVTATDPEGDVVNLGSTNLPPGASLGGSASGTGTVTRTFSWPGVTLATLFPRVGNCTTYTFSPTFRASDASTTAVKTATVNLLKAAADHAPIAIGKGPGGAVAPNATYGLYGDRSCDPDGQSMGYEWKQPPAGTAVLQPVGAANVSAVAPSTGGTTVTSRLTVRNAGGVASTDVPVTVSSYQPPRCFIATAAYGSPLAPQVDLLRAYRDGVLARSSVGRTLVASYYRLAPPVAQFIEDKPWLRALVRGALRPLIAFVRKQLAQP